MILDGKLISEQLKDEIKEEVKKYLIKPCLAVIQVGDDPASTVYVKNKEKACLETGIYFKHIKLEPDITQNIIMNKIIELNNDDYVNGILIQMPLPNHLDATKLINTIIPSKDVDGLHDLNVGRLNKGLECFVPGTAAGIMYLLNEYNVALSGKHVVIVGRSNLVGKPLASLLLQSDATVTICHSGTVDLKHFTKEADILIVATGVKGLIIKDMVKKDAIVIDVGITRVDKKLYGDVVFDEVKDISSMITPVPGGVGPMTVAMLLKNVLISYQKMNKMNK